MDLKIRKEVNVLKDLLSYLPLDFSLEFLYNPGISSLNWEERKEVVVLFSDIVGFTQISESLSKLGKEGTEELNFIINDYFRKISKIIISYGGYIQKIAGDAITVFFLKQDHPWDKVIMQAIACAGAMQRFMSEFIEIETKSGLFSLSMTIGISHGEVYTNTLGSDDLGIERIIAGRPIDRAAEANHIALSSEVWLCKETYDYVQQIIGFIHQQADYYRIKRITEQDYPLSIPKKIHLDLPIHLIQDATQEFKKYLPHNIFERIELGIQEFLGEHRYTTVMFINLTGLELLETNYGDYLQDYYSRMQKIIWEHHGFLYEFESGDKGDMIIALFGSPVSYTGDQQRALTCALQLQEEAKQLPYITSQRIGITTGNLYAGIVGSSYFKRYAVMGDTVNLAARLMTTAEPNTILVEENTYLEGQRFFQFKELDPVTVKGKSKPIAVFILEDKRVDFGAPIRRDYFEEKYFLRSQVLKRFNELKSKTLQEKSQILLITGGLGVGKTTHVQQLKEMAEKEGFDSYFTQCYEFSKNTPYAGWHPILNQVFGIKESMSNTEKTITLQHFFAQFAYDLVDKVDILSPFIHFTTLDNEAIKTLEASVKKNVLFSILTRSFQYLVKQKPLLFIIEDIQWINSSAYDLLIHLARELKSEKVLWLLTSNTHEVEQSGDFPITKMENFNHEFISELMMKELEDYIHRAWNIKDIPAEFLRQLNKNTQGNPLFIREILISLIENRILIEDPQTQELVWNKEISDVSLPYNIKSMIVSRIDRLDETSKLILKVASVIGPVFELPILREILPITEEQKQEIEWILQRLADENMIAVEGNQRYSFQQNLVQEILYGMLSLSFQSRLHLVIAQYLENHEKQKNTSLHNLLAYHYGFTDQTEKKLQYLSLSAQAAQGSYANKEAIGYYKQMMTILEQEIETSDPEDAGNWTRLTNMALDVCQQIGELYLYLGNMEESISYLNKARDELLLVEDPIRKYNLMRNLGEWYEFRDKYKHALVFYTRALNTIQRTHDNNLICKAYGYLGNIYRIMGDYKKARDNYECALSYAKKMGDLSLEGRWFGNIGTLYLNEGNYDKALENYFKALDISVKTGDKHREAPWLNLIGEVYVIQSKYPQAIDYCQRSLSVLREIGYKRSEIQTLITLGQAYGYYGRYQEGLEQYFTALEIAQDIGAENLEVIILGQVGEIYRWKESYNDALKFYMDSLLMAKRLGDKYNEALWNRGIGVVLYNRENPDYKRAYRFLWLSRQQSKQIGHKKLYAESTIHMGMSLANDGEIDEALKYVTEGYDLARQIKHPGLSLWGRRMYGIVLIKMLRKEEGIKELIETFKQNKYLGIKRDMAECALELGIALQDPSYLETAKQLFTELNLNSRLLTVEKELKSLEQIKRN